MPDSPKQKAPEPMFTFTTSSSAPEKAVRCHNCDWAVSGDDPELFSLADSHVCPDTNPRTEAMGELNSGDAIVLYDALGEVYGDKPPEHWNKIAQSNYEIARERLRALSEAASA